ncbi:2-methylcitrate dehydratase [Asanoa ishikariensis]|uniref:2-methylcitrate dehydratase PrpD n=1 Tax=Asanoa ishikariensis TaxID=137265 RepID=A0A1H3UHA6_9ACTN|nr:MmgE/PrpD family protein [Asanoa ishikariensis]GIF63639.1 2-methylcitrate dehydratase [Asanoa ishikariensis]SDZ61185.1 2-methylcitrate dehydratase PrpD [Asanoa ishikariensis]
MSTVEAVARLGDWVAGLRWADVPSATRDRLGLVLLDSLGVTVVGARQPEQRALAAAWRPSAGPAPLVGGGVCTTVEAAAWLNATAMARLELDEGHKYAKGHPAAHGLPAVLALAADLGASGPSTLAALLAAYEVAARFGRATTLRAGMHPHGSWGVAGAAAGCAKLLGLPADQVAAAIDAGAGLPVAGHFASALDGNPVRDAWLGASNVSGLAAARMAAAGVARNTGTPALSLGDVLGSFDPGPLTDALGERWDVDLGYFKRHASCSFTHPAADAALAMRGLDLGAVEEIVVETHSLGGGLGRTTWDSRLGALFSTPFVVAAALVHGAVDPAVSADEGRDDPRVRALAAKVALRVAPDLDARLPDERAARVTVRMAGAEPRVVEVPNPIGDAAHHPMAEDDVLALLGRLLDPGTVATVHDVATGLPDSPDIGPALRRLADI